MLAAIAAAAPRMASPARDWSRSAWGLRRRAGCSLALATPPVRSVAVRAAGGSAAAPRRSGAGGRGGSGSTGAGAGGAGGLRRDRLVVGEELVPGLADRVRVGAVLLVHLLDQPRVGPEPGAGRPGDRHHRPEYLRPFPARFPCQTGAVGDHRVPLAVEPIVDGARPGRLRHRGGRPRRRRARRHPRRADARPRGDPRQAATTSRASRPSASTACSARPGPSTTGRSTRCCSTCSTGCSGPYQLSAPTGIQIGPGEAAQILHRDDSIYPLPEPHAEVVLNTMWAFDDFTVENGATRFVAGQPPLGAGPPAAAGRRDRPGRDAGRAASPSTPAASGTAAAPTAPTGPASA